jgi:hypothetical protein
MYESADRQRLLFRSLFVSLVYCAESTVRWFVVREKHCWMAADSADIDRAIPSSPEEHPLPSSFVSCSINMHGLRGYGKGNDSPNGICLLSSLAIRLAHCISMLEIAIATAEKKKLKQAG